MENFVKKFVVKRSSWLRGDDLDSFLLREYDGKMCCLGFYSLACGYQENEILEKTCPVEVENISKYPSFFFKKKLQDPTENLDSDVTSKLMNINDSPKISDQKREEELTAKFAELGIQIIFED